MYIYNMYVIHVSLSLYIDRQPLNEQSSLPTPCHWDRSLLLFVGLWKSRSSERTMTAYLTSCYTAILVWCLVHSLDPGSSRMETVFQAHSWVLTSDMTGQSLNDLGRPMSVQHAPGSKMFQGWLHVVYWHWEVPGYPRYCRTWKLRGRKHQPDNEMQEYQWFNWAQVQPSHLMISIFINLILWFHNLFRMKGFQSSLMPGFDAEDILSLGGSESGEASGQKCSASKDTDDA